MKPPRFPELDLLTSVVGDGAAQKIARAPGGWRTLSDMELGTLGVSTRARKTVLALQKLTERRYAELPVGELSDFPTVAGIYSERLGALEHEVVIAIAIDGKHRVLGEFEVARGGRHGAALTAADILRPLIRAGASAAILVHNHPSGDPTPSQEDIQLTKALRNAGLLVGLPLIDHIIVAARGGGAVSLREGGALEEI